jgi:hypothetical protein
LTASSGYQGSFPKSAIDLASGKLAVAHTDHAPNSWICYDFKRLKVNVSHYALRSRSEDPSHHLQNWTIEGSLNGTNWIELDRRNECRELLGMNRSATFQTSRGEFVQLVRLRQHGVNSSNEHCLTLSAFELFGTVRSF